MALFSAIAIASGCNVGMKGYFIYLWQYAAGSFFLGTLICWVLLKHEHDVTVLGRELVALAGIMEDVHTHADLKEAETLIEKAVRDGKLRPESEL